MPMSPEQRERMGALCSRLEPIIMQECLESGLDILFICHLVINGSSGQLVTNVPIVNFGAFNDYTHGEAVKALAAKVKGN